MVQSIEQILRVHNPFARKFHRISRFISEGVDLTNAAVKLTLELTVRQRRLKSLSLFPTAAPPTIEKSLFMRIGKDYNKSKKLSRTSAANANTKMRRFHSLTSRGLTRKTFA